MISATRLSAQDVFTKYDTDKSGTISFTEFQRMLPDLGIGLSVPTQIEYFRLCDKDCSGQIDFEEFKVALYACDTEEVNPAGFNPGAILRPKGK
jgi:Ca2+-binding EF-hand superfamily protein